MKKHYILKLWLIGIINALAFMFIPPLHSLSRHTGYLPTIDTDIFMLLLLILCGIVGYANIVFIKKAFSSDLQRMRLRKALLPFAGWLVTVTLVITIQLYGEYLKIATNDYRGGFSVYNMERAVWILYLLLNGLTIPISSFIAYFKCKRKRENQK